MITRIKCGRSRRAHPLGVIDADSDGLRLTYRESVLTVSSDLDSVLSPQDGWHYRRDGVERVRRYPADEILGVDLWCSHCKTGHPVNVNALFAAAKIRTKVVTLTNRGTWEGLWTDTPNDAQ